MSRRRDYDEEDYDDGPAWTMPPGIAYDVLKWVFLSISFILLLVGMTAGDDHRGNGLGFIVMSIPACFLALVARIMQAEAHESKRRNTKV